MEDLKISFKSRLEYGRLKEIVEKVVIKKEVLLSSGRKSNFYIDGRQVTLDSLGCFLFGLFVYEFMLNNDFFVLAGLTIGADPIISSVLAISGSNNVNMKGLIIRKSPKSHGLSKQIEGPLVDKNAKILLVDDVATTGNSILKAKEVLASSGFHDIDTAFVLVDREEGAYEKLKKEKINLVSLFKKSDFIT